MTTRNEIIAQIDIEISRLERARDFLAAALAGSNHDAKTASAIALARRAKKRPPAQSRQRTALPAATAMIVAPPLPQPKEEPQIQRVPPKRRMERRHLQTEKPGKSGAALSGLVPSGPVAVSADEARKVQERSLQTAPPPIPSEPRPEIGAERSLGSLIQAFERRAGLSGLETP
jgi:hypothetical protein